MKRQLLTTLLLLNIFFLNAQNYRTINIGDTAHFNFTPSPSSQNIRSIFVDSFAAAGTDIELYGYRTFEYDSAFCFPLGRTTWLGKKIVQAANGFDYYLIGVSDTVFINTQAGVGNTWHFYNYANGDYIEATVLNLLPQAFLGITDNVKTFELQAKNSLGVSIPNIQNGKQLSVSENYGWINTFMLKKFPADTISYTLAGHTNAALGYTNFGAAEIFNFDVGDEFHYHDFLRWSISDYQEFFSIHKVLTKNISANGDTLFYTDSVYSYHRNQNGMNITVWYDSNLTSPQYIISQQPLFHSKVMDQMLFDSVSIFQGNGEFTVRSDVNYFSRYRKRAPLCLTMFSSPCYEYGIDCNYSKEYAIGLGQIVSDNSVWYPCYDSLVYYKKGAQIWGQPINWQQLLNVSEPQNNSLSLQVFPNPVDDVINIKSEGVISSAKVEIKDISGKEIYSTYIPGNEKDFSIPFKNAAKGIYFLTVSSVNGNANFKLVK